MRKLSLPSRDEVEAFLGQCRSAIEARKIDFVPREKNLEGVAQLGLRTRHVWDEITVLTARNYYRGPSVDHDPVRGGIIYEFGTRIEDREVYIKLKYDERRGCVCMSFHPAARPITYPLGGERL